MYRRFFKRFFDIVLSFIAIGALAPLFLPVMVILFFTGEHQVFYRQTRVGYMNQRFRIWKFTTMIKGSSKIGTGSLTVKNDPRVLPFGRFLRRTKINELPQVFNILLGDMSIVGPRPQMEVDFNKYPLHIQSVIYKSRPGMTGIGSIVFRDEEKWISRHEGDKHEFYRHNIAPYKGELELWYLEHTSFTTDLMLIFITAWVVVFPASEIVYRLFKDLPEKPDGLEA